MTLSRCGRQYPDFNAAYKAAESRTYKGKPMTVVSCAIGEHWHVTTRANARSTGERTGLDPFPPAVRAQLVTRDECCQRCGSTGRLEAHHRRAKHMGGSKGRSHTQCACNGVMVCRRCHSWIHSNPKQARAEGWIVSQSVSLPGSVSFYRRFPLAPPGTPLDDRDWNLEHFPTCEGGWRFDD